MNSLIPPGFEGDHYSNVFAIDLTADILNEERWEVDEISERIFKRIIGRKICRQIDTDTEKELFIRYRKGDEEARNTLILANLRLVNAIARRFRPNKFTCNDVLSEGLIGLLKAMDYYDVNSYYRFSSFAYRIIFNHIHSFLIQYNSLIVIPTSIKSLRSKYIAFTKKYFQEYLCLPSEQVVAEALQINPYKANGLRISMTDHISLDRLCDYLGYDFVIDYLIDDIIDSEPDTFDTSNTYESFICDIEEVLSNLEKREADIIRKFFGIGCRHYTLEEIGYIYDITRERARQIREKAIQKLKGIIGKPLRQYVTEC